MKYLLLLSLLFSICACSKKEENRFCWQTLDYQGNLLQIVCDKTEAEMQALYSEPCNYYKTDGEKFCWLSGNNGYYENFTEEGMRKIAQCRGLGNLQKIDCGYCKNFYHRYKYTYKPTGIISYSVTKREMFCGDTLSKLFHGRQLIVKDTPDSLVVLQFSSNASF